MQLIDKYNSHQHLADLAQMHQLRKRIFADKCKWPVNIVNGMEFDQFDTQNAKYLVHKVDNKVVACVRLLPTTQGYLLGEVFPELVEKIPLPRSKYVWEITRLCADKDLAPRNIMNIMLTSIMEFGVHHNIKYFVSIADIRTEKLIKRAGWFAERLGDTINTGTEIAVSQKLDVSHKILKEMKLKAMPYDDITYLTEQALNEFRKTA